MVGKVGTVGLTSVPLAPVTGYEDQVAQIARQRAIADALLNAKQPAVMTSPLQTLAQIFDAYGGNRLEKKADDTEATLNAQRLSDQKNTLAQVMADMQGGGGQIPAAAPMSLAAPSAQPGLSSGTASIPTTPPPSAAPPQPTQPLSTTDILTKYSGQPGFAGSVVEKVLQARAEAEAKNSGEYNAPINVMGSDGQMHLRSYNKAGGYQEDQTGATLPTEVGVGPSGQVYNKYTGKQTGAAPLTNYGQEVILGPDGKPVVNSALVGAKEDIARAGKSQTNVSVKLPAIESAYGQSLGKYLGDADGKTLDAARQAPMVYQGAQRVKDLLKTGQVFTGTGASARLTIANAMQTAGLSNDPRVANTQALVSQLAQQTLNHVKTSGLGAGNGFTDTDREFVEKASGGNIAMSAPAIQHLADLSQKAAMISQKQGQAVFARMNQNPAAAAMTPGLASELNQPLAGEGSVGSRVAAEIARRKAGGR